MKKRNWPAIVSIGRQNKFLMLALVTGSDNSKNAKILRAAFPECFTNVKGPVPLSHLKEECLRRNKDDDYYEWQWKTYNIVRDYSLPALTFCHTEGWGEQVNTPGNFFSEQLTREEVTMEHGQGKVVSWNDQKFLVVENTCGCITLVPTDALVMDL